MESDVKFISTVWLVKFVCLRRQWIGIFGLVLLGMWRRPGFAEFRATGGFFGSDVEMFADTFAGLIPVSCEVAEVVFAFFVGAFILLGFEGELFAAESEGVFAEFDGALEEIEATIVLGDAFAGDLNALDVEFVFFVAVEPAGNHGELVVGGVGRGGALEKVTFEGGSDAVVEGSVVAGGGVGKLSGVLELVGGVFGPAAVLEALESGDLDFDAEAVGRGEGDFFGDFWDGHFYKPVVELVSLLVGE